GFRLPAIPGLVSAHPGTGGAAFPDPAGLAGLGAGGGLDREAAQEDREAAQGLQRGAQRAVGTPRPEDHRRTGGLDRAAERGPAQEDTAMEPRTALERKPLAGQPGTPAGQAGGPAPRPRSQARAAQV